MPKANNQPIKKFLSLAVSWVKVVKNGKIQFSMSKIIRIFLNFFFVEEYQFRDMFLVIDIFWKLQFLKRFFY